MFCTLYGVQKISQKNFQIKKKSFSFYFVSFNFFMLFMLLLLVKRQSELSGFRPDTCGNSYEQSCYIFDLIYNSLSQNFKTKMYL